MKELCSKLVQDTQQLGATECEACIEDTIKTIITIEMGFIHGKREKKSVTFGLRTLLDTKKGFVAGTLPVKSLPHIEKASLALAGHAAPGCDWKHLPYPKGFTHVQGIYDKKLAETDAEELAEHAVTMVTAADRPGITIDTGRICRTVTTFSICNSHGISHEYESTRLDVHFVCRCGKSESTWGVHCSRDYDVDCAALAEDTVKRAESVRSPKYLDSSFTGDVVLLTEPVEDILLAPLTHVVSAQPGDPLRTEYSNKRVASDVISVYDDGTLFKGIHTSPIDGEGNPTQRTNLITKGVLTGLLHSEYTANMNDTVSTGNGVRQAVTQPKLQITNLILEKGRASVEELIGEVKKGVLVGDFSGNINGFDGSFDGVLEHSFYIEKGEIKYPVMGVLRGNAFEWLMKVENTAKEQKTGEGGMYAVPVLIRDVEIMK
jgi:PmbA protein